MSGARNIKGGLILISFGILGGMAMSTYAFKPETQYNDLRERILRLAHVSAIMLPLLNIVLGMFLHRIKLSGRSKAMVSYLLLIGAVGTPAALVASAFLSPLSAFWLSAIPVTMFSSGAFLVSFGAWKTDFGPLDASSLYSKR